MKLSPVYFLMLISLSLWMGSSGCKKDLCKDVVCENGGVCLDGSCECQPGFVGDRCESVDISTYLGTYRVEYEGCFDTSPIHMVGIAESSEESFSITFLDLGDYECPSDGRIKVHARVTTEEILIPEQTICSDGNFFGYTYVGQGNKEADTIRLAFSVRYEADGISKTDSCQAIMVKE